MDIKQVNAILFEKCQRLYERLSDTHLQQHHEFLRQIDFTKIKDDTEQLLQISNKLENVISEHMNIYRDALHTSDLTQLGNRRALHNFIKDSGGTGGERAKNDYCVISLDITGLKIVNDTGRGGHLAGDKLIRAASEAIKTTIRETDIYHVSGDEFVVILKNCPHQNAIAKCHKIITNLKTTCAHDYEKAVGVPADKIGMNFGIATHDDPEVHTFINTMVLEHIENKKCAPNYNDQSAIGIRAALVVADYRMEHMKNKSHNRAELVDFAFKYAVEQRDYNAILSIANRYNLKEDEKKKVEQQKLNSKYTRRRIASSSGIKYGRDFLR
jgi:diguanylate cyclase (GGDEF)-like protein